MQGDTELSKGTPVNPFLVGGKKSLWWSRPKLFSHACRFTHNKPAPCTLRRIPRRARPQACVHALGENGGFLSQSRARQALPGCSRHCWLTGLCAHSLGPEPDGRVKLAPDEGTERQLNKAGLLCCSPNPRFVEWYLSNYLRQDLRKEDFELILTTELFGGFLVASKESLRFTRFCQCHLMETYQVRHWVQV